MFRGDFKQTTKICQEVENFGKDTEDLIDELFTLCSDEAHIGLAAPQIGVDKRVFVVTYEDIVDAFVNPQVTILVPYTFSHWEECLSLPTITALVDRYYKIKIVYLDREGRTRTRVLQEFKAAVIQHEMDHLVGKMIHTVGSQVQRVER
jgi:peptide deformylase